MDGNQSAQEGTRRASRRSADLEDYPAQAIRNVATRHNMTYFELALDIAYESLSDEMIAELDDETARLDEAKEK